MNPKVSIIIPCKDIDELTSESIDMCSQLDYDNFEIIVSTGEFLAFIDSDAYPQKDWLKNAVRYFSDPEVAAVGGHGVTPDEDPVLQKAGGFILSSFMVGGIANRYGSAKSRESETVIEDDRGYIMLGKINIR